MDQVHEIKEKTDIVNLINEYVPLKKTGNNFKALCPFHNEKSPSFVVSPERQIWHCFSCNLGGDCFTFLMQFEHIEFPEALRILAKRTGIELSQYKFDSGISTKKEKIYQINTVACEYYHYVLQKHPAGKTALHYLLEKRLLKPQTINTYMLGFAPYERNALVAYLLYKKKYANDEILEAGLATSYSGELKDFFQGRIIFPLYDHRNNIIGFSGRILEGKNSKYINTRETLVYHKGSVFFGLNSSKESIKKENRAIIMEGEFDVIASFQEGITNTVAVKGTALTEDQVNLIARFAKKVTLCFDGDSAGKEAIKRSLAILEKKGLITSVVVIPNGKDADESIKNDPVAFKQAVRHDNDVYDYLFDLSFIKNNPQTAEGKKKIGDDLLSVFAHIENEIIKEHHLKKLSKALNISMDSLIKEIEKIGKKEVIHKNIEIAKVQKSREEMLEEYFISLIVQYENPYILLNTTNAFLKQYKFTVLAYQKILILLLEYRKTHSFFDAKDFLKSLPAELVETFDICFLFPISKFRNDGEYQSEVKKTVREMYSLWLRKRIKFVGTQIKEKDKKEDELIQLQAELSRLISLLPKG